MYYLIIQLFKQEYKEDLFLAFTSCGIKKATFVEGFNLDKTLQEEFSLFKGIIPSKEQMERYSIMVHSIVEKKEDIDDLINLLIESGIDIDNEEIMRIVLLPVIRVKDSDIDWKNENL
ncbi:MAG: hypothetical protein DRP84_00890 [Spirochaetes bacterium]|nr:MAG: hypothetical protein DRP84_00890 [Spirochaetota bacterium]RKY03468.1 MAG: hypothetical protein DRP55_01305 [Spirochaetota bacterium]